MTEVYIVTWPEDGWFISQVFERYEDAVSFCRVTFKDFATYTIDKKRIITAEKLEEYMQQEHK